MMTILVSVINLTLKLLVGLLLMRVGQDVVQKFVVV